jgi:hypothetical protein
VVVPTDTWRLETRAISVVVTSLAHDGVAAFLMGRGVPSGLANRYASNCVERIVVSHRSGRGSITYDVRDWRVEPGALRLKTREDWVGQREAGHMGSHARLGFEFSQLPTAERLAVGDSAQGMAAIALPAGSRFDLSVAWSDSRGRHRAVLQGVVCHAA